MCVCVCVCVCTCVADLTAVEGEGEELFGWSALHNTRQSSELLLIQPIVLKEREESEVYVNALHHGE